MKVIILTEGTKATGYGHLTRCLSLYQAFEEKGIEPLFIANCDEGGKNYIAKTNFLQIDWMTQQEKFLEIFGFPDVTVIDSYLAGVNIYNELQSRAQVAAYIDDYIRINYPPGVIVNGTIGAENLEYARNGFNEHLLGVQYIPLRKEFWQVSRKNINSDIKKILLSFGGEDIRNLTRPIANYLIKKFPSIKLDIVIGTNSEFEFDLPNAVLHRSLSASEMLRLMLENDLAIVAAGQTLYELVRAGIPTIAIGVADNQEYNLIGWERSRFIKKALRYNSENLYSDISEQLMYYQSKSNRESIYSSSRKFIDGQGANRIVENLISRNTHE